MTTTTTRAPVRVDARLRGAQDRFNAERPEMLCVYDLCSKGHSHDPIPLPQGVHPISAPKGGKHLVLLVRYTVRSYGGYHVVRADNGRVLGWVYRLATGEHAGRWSSRIAPQAFCGDGPDDVGDLLDSVPYWLHNGKPGQPTLSREIAYDRTRDEATHSIVAWLARHDAPAAGFGRHQQVLPWHPSGR